MRRLNDFLTEDTNQFGPGTDLIVSLLAVLLVMVSATSHLYSEEVKKSQEHVEEIEKARVIIDKAKKEMERESSGHFKLAKEYFTAGDFKVLPVTDLTNPEKTKEAIARIAKNYDELQADYPYIFIIGHSNQLDDPLAMDKSYRARLERNWEYAGRRAAVIAGLLQLHLSNEQKERLVVVTTGEFDMKAPEDPYSPENAWVEVVFGKEWKPPVRESSN